MAACRRLMTVSEQNTVISTRLSGVLAKVKVNEVATLICPKELAELAARLRAEGRNVVRMREVDLVNWLSHNLPAAPKPAPAEVPVADPVPTVLQRVQNRAMESLRELERVEKARPDLALDNLHRLLREVLAASQGQAVHQPVPTQADYDSDKLAQQGGPLAAPAWWGRLKCRVGCHQWESETDTVVGGMSRKHIALGWRVCRRCSTSQLTLILR